MKYLFLITSVLLLTTGFSVPAFAQPDSTTVTIDSFYLHTRYGEGFLLVQKTKAVTRLNDAQNGAPTTLQYYQLKGGKAWLHACNPKLILPIPEDCMADGYQQTAWQRNRLVVTQTTCRGLMYLTARTYFYLSGASPELRAEKTVFSFTDQRNPNRKIVDMVFPGNGKLFKDFSLLPLLKELPRNR